MNHRDHRGHGAAEENEEITKAGTEAWNHSGLQKKLRLMLESAQI